MMIVQLVTYACLLTAVIAIIAKIMRYALAPEHFRWELYPVPHEKGRAEYGGSFLEELDWWSKPRKSDMVSELKEMMEEVFLLKGVYRNNRRVWTFSLPFHLGLYLCIGWLVLLLGGGILSRLGFAVSGAAGGLGAIIHFLTIPAGYGGLLLSGVGAFGLLIWRATDRDQRGYNSPAEYFNLAFFDVIVIVALISHLTTDPDFSALRGYVGSLVTFSPAQIPGPLFVAEIVLISLMIAYIPLTRMSHFVAKYFLYHAVRWNDEPNERGSRIEKSILEQLKRKVEWAAPHIQTGKPWSDVVKETEDE